MKFLKYLLLLLFPALLQAQTLPHPRCQIYPGEYDCYAVNPLDSLLYSVVTGQPIPGAPKGIKGGSASLHHAFFIGLDDSVWVVGDNSCNISGMGLSGSSLPMTKTKIGNAKQVIAYANGGDGAGNGLGYGGAVVTKDGKLILVGNTQSGFRNDGTEGNNAEPAPYVVPLPKAVQKAAIGEFCYVLFTDGTVYDWGGTRIAWHPTYCLARGIDNPDPTHGGYISLPDSIIDIQGGGEFSYFISKTNIYAVAYNTHFIGFGDGVPAQNIPFNLTKILNLPSIPIQLAVAPLATYALMANGDAWAWGDNSEAEMGNGIEASSTLSTGIAPWQGGALWQTNPIKVNPAGVVFTGIFTSIGDAFYVFYEDSSRWLWNNGRNKGGVLWNGQGGTSVQEAATPNKWDVLTVTKIVGFGAIPPATTVVAPPTCPLCPSCPPPVVCPICPPTPSPRLVTSVTIHINGLAYSVPISWLTFSFSDGSTQ